MLARIEGDGRRRGRPRATSGRTRRSATLAKKIEAHLIGFSGDLYGKSVELDFLERLRATRKFAGREELLAQIKVDVEETERICRSANRECGDILAYALGRCS